MEEVKEQTRQCTVVRDVNTVSRAIEQAEETDIHTIKKAAYWDEQCTRQREQREEQKEGGTVEQRIA